MKTKVALMIICLCGFSIFIHASNTVKGNGKVITQEISISDYEEISMAGSVEFEYEQSNGAPSLFVTVDENILPYLDIKTKGKTLEIGVKKDSWRGVNIRPTVYKIRSSSKNLRKLNAAGSGKFYVNGNLQTNRTEFNLAGSGQILLQGQIQADEIKFNIAGSGKANAHHLLAKKFDGSVAGSGRLVVGGTAQEASYRVAGSGNVKAYDYKAEKVSASVSGSGKVEVSVTGHLEAHVSGSGNITYKGEGISTDISKYGSGSIKKAD
ncbi:MAG: DUF2807 domain-containing protein [Tannerellaceae bacterium]|nr:DUF2807 domain-containing protein [Tannerellaceae bacterium]